LIYKNILLKLYLKNLVYDLTNLIVIANQLNQLVSVKA